MTTEVGHISGMLQASTAGGDPAHQPAEQADEPDPHHRRPRPGGVDRDRPLAEHAVRRALPDRDRVLGLGDPDRPAGGRHGGPLRRDAEARRGRRDREAAPLGRDARLDVSAINSDKTGTLTLNQMTAVQMAVVGRRYAISGEGYSTVGQITHSAGQPDVPLDQLLLPMALCADAEVKDGKLVGDPTEGALVVLAAKGGVDPTADPGAVPARRDAAVRRGVQAHGDVPPDDGRRRQGRHPGVRQGRPGPAPRPGHVRPRARRRRGPRSTRSATTTWPRTSATARRACASWRPARRTSTRRPSTQTPISCRSSTGSSCSLSSASSTRPGPRPATRSPRPTMPASRSG